MNYDSAEKYIARISNELDQDYIITSIKKQIMKAYIAGYREGREELFEESKAIIIASNKVKNETS